MSLTPEANPESLKLEFPEPQPLQIDNETLLAFNLLDYAKLLEIFATYQYLSDQYLIQKEGILLLNTILDSTKTRLDICHNMATTLAEDREHAYNLAQETIDLSQQQAKRNTLKIVLYTGGGIAVGIGIGILVGIFAI